MDSFVKAYDNLSTLTHRVFEKYWLAKDFMLRGIEGLEKSALNSLLLLRVVERRLKLRNILQDDNWDHNDELINIANEKKAFEPVFQVCKFERPDYQVWLQDKTLCTYHENWEFLAYFVCEIYGVDVTVTPVVCDLIMDIGVRKMDCLVDVDVDVDAIDCEKVVDVDVDVIKCGPDVDISAKVAKCDVDMQINVEKSNCDRVVDVKALIEDCSTKYNIDVDLVKCIVSDVYPGLVTASGDCIDESDIGKSVIDFEKENT